MTEQDRCTMLSKYPRMKPLIPRCFLWAAAFAVSALCSLVAQTPAAGPVDADVADVKFGSVRVGSNTWYEIQIDVATRAGAATDNKRFLNKVKVTLNLGIFSAKAPSGAKVPDTYYRASAEAVAVEATGGKTTFRFYLPPEIVKRDTLTGDQKFYLVELSVDGKPVPLNARTHITTTALPNAAALESFRGEVSSKSGVNDGILLPQHLTPLAFDNSRPYPSMIRLETTR